jgi:hypothetical protein
MEIRGDQALRVDSDGKGLTAIVNCRAGLGLDERPFKIRIEPCFDRDMGPD